MPWTIAYRMNGHTFEVDACTTNVLYWLDSNAPIAGPRLCLSLKALSEMSDDDTLAVTRWFLEHAQEIDTIQTADEGHYHEQFTSDEDLELIISSGLASDRQKRQAEGERDRRLYGYSIEGLPEEPAPPKPKQKRPGYIYLAYSETDHYKIGKSVGPEERISVFDTQMPVEVTMLHSFEADDMAPAELALHERFSDKRVRGEWFELDSNEVEEIKGISSYQGGKFI